MSYEYPIHLSVGVVLFGGAKTERPAAESIDQGPVIASLPSHEKPRH